MPVDITQDNKGYPITEYIIKHDYSYVNDIKEGVCYGFAHMSKYAMLLGVWNDTFICRLEKIGKLFHHYPSKTPIFLLRQEKIDIAAFLNGIVLYQLSQDPIEYKRLLNIKDSSSSSYLQDCDNIFKPIVFQQKQIDINSVYHINGCYTIQELFTLLQIIEEIILNGVLRHNAIDTKFNHRIPIQCSMADHTSMLGYNYRDNTWIIADIILLSKNNGLSIVNNSYSKADIVNLLCMVFAGDYISNLNVEQTLALDLKIYLANQQNKEYLAQQFNSDLNFKRINQITQNKLNMNINGSWLLLAVQNAHTKTVELLITAGADVNLADESGDTPILVAAANGHDRIVELLIAAGANVDFANNLEKTPIFLAAANGHDKIVELLIVVGANVNFADESGAIPIGIAAQNGHTKIVELLIAARANVNLADESGATPIWAAAENGHNKIVELLIAARANVSLTHKSGATPIWIAAQNGHDKIVELLIKAKVDITSPTNFGVTPLNIAQKKGHHKVVDLLIAALSNKECRPPASKKYKLT